jgi:hypothetical protein
LEGCGLLGCCEVYDCVCSEEGFGLLLAKFCELIASLTPVIKTPYEAFGIHQSDSCLCIIKDVAVKLTHVGYWRQFLGDSGGIKLEVKYGTITKRCILLIKCLTVPDTNNLIVNIEITELK